MINILGLAGSGKSTQAQLLAGRINCPWISMSHLLRAKGNAEVQADMLKGKIIGDDVTMPILEQDLREKEADKKECVVDGWPRTLAQAETLAELVSSGQVMMSGIIHLKAHQEVAKERLIHRGRIDDTEEAIIQRFKDYQQNILPILEYLKGQGLPIFEVDADGEIAEVEARIDEMLKLT